MPVTFLQGDLKLGNLGSHPDGRTVLLDWSLAGGMAGVLRQLAREVAVMNDVAEEGRCRCGGLIAQPWTGRPRKFCTSCSPQRKTRGKGESGERQSEQRSAA
jgi:hypothetical protein